jgi:hypothetical protein
MMPSWMYRLRARLRRSPRLKPLRPLAVRTFSLFLSHPFLPAPIRLSPLRRSLLPSNLTPLLLTIVKKAERDRLLAEEESSMPSKPKAAPKAGAKKLAPAIPSFNLGANEEGSVDDITAFSASGIVRFITFLFSSPSHCPLGYELM